MKNRFKVVAMIAVVGLAGIVCYAGPQAGQIEVAGVTAGSLSSPLEGGGTSTSLGAGIGYFITSQCEIRTDLSFMKYGDMDGIGTVTIGVDYVADFETSLYPYVGVAVGMMTAGGESDMLGSLHGGMKFFVSETWSLNMELRGNFPFEEPDRGEVQAFFGLSAYFTP